MFNILEELEKYIPYDKFEAEDRNIIISELKKGTDLTKNNKYKHFTAGALICDKCGNILLDHHKKSGLWLQFGGHTEINEDIFGTAKREIQEETGITDYYTDGKIFDVSIHKIDNKDNNVHYHYDINFLFIVNKKAFIGSDESLQIKWVTIEEAHKLSYKGDKALDRMIDKYEKYLKTLKQKGD